MADNLGPGLSDFGLSAPSESNSVGTDKQPLEVLLGGGLDNKLLDDVAREKILRQRMADLASQDTPGLLDRLKSPQGLLALLGTVGAGIAGGPGAAAGFGVGSLEGMSEAKAAEESLRRKSMEDISKRLDDTEERILKRNQMFATALQQAPDQFIDPKTGELSAPPELLGYYAYGVPIKVNPGTKRTLDQRDDRWKQRMNLLEDALKNTTDLGDARILTKSLFQHLGEDNPNPDEIESLARSYGSPEFEDNLAATLLRHGGQTALDAMVYAGENNLPLHDPEVLRRIKAEDPSKNAAPSQVLNQRFLDLMDKVRKFEQDPTNAQLVSKLRQEAKTPEEARRQIAEQALVDAADVGFYEQKIGGMPSFVRSQYQAAYNSTVGELALARTVRGAQSIEQLAQLPEGDFRRMAADMAWKRIQENEDAVQQGHAQSAAALLDKETGALLDAFPTASHGAARRQAQALYEQAVKELGQDATQTQIEQRFAAKVNLYIQSKK